MLQAAHYCELSLACLGKTQGKQSVLADVSEFLTLLFCPGPHRVLVPTFSFWQGQIIRRRLGRLPAGED